MPDDDKDLDAMLADLLGDKKEEKKAEEKKPEKKAEEPKEEPKEGPKEEAKAEPKEEAKVEVKVVEEKKKEKKVERKEVKAPEPVKKVDIEEPSPPTFPERKEPKVQPRPEIVPIEEKAPKMEKKEEAVEKLEPVHVPAPEPAPAPAQVQPPAPAPAPEPAPETIAPAPTPAPAPKAVTRPPEPGEGSGAPPAETDTHKLSLSKRKAMRKAVTEKVHLPRLFEKWDTREVVVQDIALKNYINLDPVIGVHSGARYANRQFGKANVHIVERLVNGMMRTEHTTGEKAKTTKWVKKAFDIIHEKTKKNPIQVYVDALQNGAPKEEVTRLRFGGISVPKAVDVSSSRRLDVALRNICTGAINSAHGSKRRIWETLANEIILCANKDMNSYAMAKRDEVERVAGSAR